MWKLRVGEGGTVETAKKGRIKNSKKGAVVLSGVWLWNSISWSVDGSPRWRLRIGVGRPGWVAVAAIAVGSRVGCGAALGQAGGVLPER